MYCSNISSYFTQLFYSVSHYKRCFKSFRCHVVTFYIFASYTCLILHLLDITQRHRFEAFNRHITSKVIYGKSDNHLRIFKGRSPPGFPQRFER